MCKSKQSRFVIKVASPCVQPASTRSTQTGSTLPISAWTSPAKRPCWQVGVFSLGRHGDVLLRCGRDPPSARTLGSQAEGAAEAADRSAAAVREAWARHPGDEQQLLSYSRKPNHQIFIALSIAYRLGCAALFE